MLWLLLMVDMLLEALGSLVAVAVRLLGGRGLVMPGKGRACKRGQNQCRRKQSLHVKDPITPVVARLNCIAGLVRIEQSGDCSARISAANPLKSLRGVVMVMVVVMVMAGSKSGWAGKHRKKQNNSENLLHGRILAELNW